MGVPILRIKGDDGQMHSVLAIRGERGQDGVSPDVNTIVQAVLAALPDGDEVSY